MTISETYGRPHLDQPGAVAGGIDAERGFVGALYSQARWPRLQPRSF